ncbi:MAG TPA: RsmE family RNA methyltransferase [Flavipsychrobacter sp.]|nr:RsmE family RNA methyltransferase [Flavipsychrobacter sp.]
MSLPMFFYTGDFAQADELKLEEDIARHVVQVLRMQPDEQLELCNGKGKSATAIITKAEKKNLVVRIEQIQVHSPRTPNLNLGVAFTKNSSRNEWLLEKATELGAANIIPIMAARTEREKIRYDRWLNIMKAALIQSQQYHLPELLEASSLKEILQRFNGVEQKLIGHCNDTLSRFPIKEVMQKQKDTLALIGPEGDFTLEEVKLCEAHGFAGMSLVSQRLRTETAAMAVCAYFNLINHSEA